MVKSLTPDMPHIIKYMGSKRNLLDFVVESIDSVRTGKDQRLYDLFAGSSVVGGSFRNKMPVTCNDVQSYSGLIGRVYLNNYNWEAFPDNVLSRIVKKAESHIKRFHKAHPGFELSYPELPSLKETLILEKKQQQLIDLKFDTKDHLFTKYFSGTYWSFDQCLWIDALSSVARSKPYKNTFLADYIIGCLMFSMAYCSQSTGHYAQYRDVTKDNLSDILMYRKKKILPLFESKFKSLAQYFNGCNNTEHDHQTTNYDFREALKYIEPNSIVYADPPYQFVHYSRFYHALETLVKYDYPEVKFKGRYRTDRHQSDFCIKSKVRGAFTDLFANVASADSSLVLSYSETGMISFDDLLRLAKETMKGYKVEVRELDYIHSTMGRQKDKSRKVVEVMLICSK
ncbi:adenine-specific DNA-methyltransferase [Neolewinella agarilytica]|uniref:Adenine-specific DNA-methyltransferase n=2 Tax=Neolewinella agarilytica TaxID=478744 RepID=A0A1H9LZP6_9BACT|nr:adenine-specific DNA-methyltransferase [Neolewinella agarilytica]